MDYDRARSRLDRLPEALPPAPEVLRPVRIDKGDLPFGPLDEQGARNAAVLVLLFPDEANEARLVLIARPPGNRVHAGEVSFPGGSVERGDRDPAATALREAREEVGLEPAAVEVVGSLESVWIPASNFRLTPVLAVAGLRPSWIVSPREVVRVLEPRVEAFLPGAPIQTVERVVRGWPLRYGAYPVSGHLVWGATARILGQLGAILAARRGRAR